MKNFFKLLNFEINRFIKLYIVLLVAVLVIQTFAVVSQAKRYMSIANESVLQGGMTQLQFIETFGKFGLMDILYSMSFLVPIALSVVALIFYVFFIWYREWFAKNTFIYRLLTLPTARMNVYFAKISAIMITVIGLVAYQIILLQGYMTVIKLIVPKVYREEYGLFEAIISSQYLSLIIPGNFLAFIINYGIGFMFVVVVFTAILFERSFKLKGIILGFLYSGIMSLIFALPMLIQIVLFGKIYLYEIEMFVVQVIMWVIIIGLSLIVSRYLLKNKVTV